MGFGNQQVVLKRNVAREAALTAEINRLKALVLVETQERQKAWRVAMAHKRRLDDARRIAMQAPDTYDMIIRALDGEFLARPVNGTTRECPKHGQYIGAGADCPVCEGRSRSARPWRFVDYPRDIEDALRRRPESGLPDE